MDGIARGQAAALSLRAWRVHRSVTSGTGHGEEDRGSESRVPWLTGCGVGILACGDVLTLSSAHQERLDTRRPSALEQESLP